MNTLDNLEVNNLHSNNSTLQNTTIGTLNVTHGIYAHDDLQLEPYSEIRFGWDNAKMYVREGRLYFYSPEIGEWALTPSKEERAKRVIDTLDE